MSDLFHGGLTLEEWLEYWSDAKSETRLDDQIDTGDVLGDLQAAAKEIKRLRQQLRLLGPQKDGATV